MSELAIADPLARDPTFTEEAATLGDDGDAEFMNLRENRTGVSGVIFLTTEMGRHGPRVKWYAKTGKDQPSFSVSIDAAPRVLASSLSDRELSRAAPAVMEWVRLNSEALVRFWHEGNLWDVDELAMFADSLKSI